MHLVTLSWYCVCALL